MLHPRESFKYMACKVAKQLIKQWPILENLIYEKLRRKSSAVKSDNSSDDGGSGS